MPSGAGPYTARTPEPGPRGTPASNQENEMFLTRLLYWCRYRQRRPLAHVQVVLYTRRGCGLCLRALRLLRATRRRWGFSLTIQEVDAQPTLQAQYGHCVPVVLVNGRLRFRGQVNPVLWERLLRGEAAQQREKSFLPPVPPNN